MNFIAAMKGINFRQEFNFFAMCKPDDIVRICVYICWLLAKSEEIDKAKEIIRKMTFNYESDTFENPGKIHSESTPLIGLIIAGLHGLGLPTFSFLPSHDVPYQPLLSLRYVAWFSQLQTGLEWSGLSNIKACTHNVILIHPYGMISSRFKLV